MNVFDQKGKLLFSNKYLFRDKVTDYPLLSVVQQAINGNEHLIEAPELYGGDGKSYLTQYPVEHVDWTVVVERRRQDILHSAYRGFFEIGAIAILLFSLTAFFIFYHRKVVLLRETGELLFTERKLREAEQAELETRIKAEQETKQLLATIQEERDRLDSLISNISDEIWFADKTGKFVLANQSAMRAFGIEATPGIEVENLAASLKVYRPDGTPRPVEEAPPLLSLAGKTVRNLEEIVRIPASGELRYRQVNSSPIRDADGNITGSVSVVRDITELKKTADELQRSNATLRGMLEATQESIWLFSADGVILQANKTALSRMGKHAEDVIGRRFNDILSPELARSRMERLRETVESGQPREFEDERSGIIFHHSFYPVFDAEQNVIQVVSFSRDTTERHRTEQAVRDGEERLRFALETNHTGAWDLDLVDHTAFRSQEHDRIFGYATLLPQWTYEMFLEHVLTEDRAAVDAKFRHAIETRSDWNFECRIQRTDGEVRWIAAAGRHYVDAAGTPRRMAGIVQDITERKRAEEELRLSEESLRQAKEGLEQRVQERTSELKQRADQLARLSSQLTMTEQNERKRLSKILHDGLQQYLVAAKMQMGGLIDIASDAALKQAAIELENLLGETITVSRSLAVELSPPILHEAGLISGLQWLSRWMSDKHGLKVELVMQMETPILAADVKVLLFESVREHLLNIVKHAKTFSARVELSQEDGRSLRVTVSDGGQGFDPASIPVFGDEGGGFGLFSIRERINLIGGRFEIDSSPGKGARFTLTVPLAVNEPLEPMPSAQPIRLNGAVESRFPRPEGKIRILLTDDHSVMREGLARLLSHEADFEIVGQADDGQQAVELAGTLHPDVILMDISMPRLNGIDATRLVHQQHPHIRIIGLSLYKEEERAKEMLDAGAVFYLTKTGPAIELKTAIRSSMRDRQINEKPSPRP